MGDATAAAFACSTPRTGQNSLAGALRRCHAISALEGIKGVAGAGCGSAQRQQQEQLLGPHRGDRKGAAQPKSVDAVNVLALSGDLNM